MNVFEELRWREMIYDSTPGLEEVFATQKVAGYIGFDPTAPSLQVGNLFVTMALVHLQRYGHTPIVVIGGGTALIGDPSGKDKERPLLRKEEIEANKLRFREQFKRFLDFDSKSNPAIMVDNADWLVPLNLIDFLRDIGKHFTVNYMLTKESVRRRLEQEEGISYTEFSYMLLQAYDFLVLYDRYNCILQMGGSDQWGNITAGIELIRRLRGGKAYGLVLPLVTTASGVKFGKTEAGTVWLDPALTSPYRFYQFWFNTDDRDVVRYLKFFTLLPPDRIEELAHKVAIVPEEREAQRTLAREVTRMVHGETALSRAEKASRILFGEEIQDITAEEVEEIFGDVPSTEVRKEELSGEGMLITELLVKCGVASSRSDGRRLIQGGGIYLNNVRVTDIELRVALDRAIEGKFLVLRKGRKDYHLVKVV
ncbi:MAG: tyrosine--tRNA ligase [Anaerolineae bacterium]|nr:tyrosine--tRNA ligase [Anaerolineae bacterium]MDW8102707.1 tyrosine--tRNA ligase [Anaerolineae bacterium]